MIRTLVAAALLSFSVATAHAGALVFTGSNGSYSTGTLTYETTSWYIPQAPGTQQYGTPTSSTGGLCAPQAAQSPGPTYYCPSLTLIPGTSAGALVSGGTATFTGNTLNTATSGLISFTTPTSGLPAGSFWSMTISLDGNPNARTGDIYEVTDCRDTSGTTCVPTGPLFTTSVVTNTITSAGACIASAPGDQCAANASVQSGVSSAAYTTQVAGGVTYTLGITDLVEQYINQTDLLPGLLNSSYAYLDGGPVGGHLPLGLPGIGVSGYNTGTLAFTVSLTAAPEPASLALLGGAVTLLGAIRRGRGSQSAAGPARQG